MSLKTVEINITGIVQGVGFRPFLFNLARNHNLKGFILNRGNAGVRLVLQGFKENIDEFIESIKKKSPKISFIEDLEVEDLITDIKYDGLNIQSSEMGRGISLTLPPDIATCDNCIEEMRDPNLNNYFQYPFIACAVCGPRFTTVTELPYDRERSTMNDFPFCESCNQEYSDFNNRRFHAQTFACSTCGPNYSLYDKSQNLIKKDSLQEILRETATKINKGDVAAVKGIGGVHLVCLADNDDVILKLRKRKSERKYKPFALMVSELKVIKDYFNISPYEEEFLTSFRRPIVLLKRNNTDMSSIISEQVAPGLNNIGIMLPYTGIHHLLFDYVGNKPLVYTSGNKSNIPMGINNDKIFDQLSHLADFFLLHNRDIFQRADDSVLRIHNDKTKLIRRSRGFVPEYLPLPFKVDIPGAIASGPELSTTGAVLRYNRIFPTQHIGDVNNLETVEFLRDAVFHIKKLLKIEDSDIKFVACDEHPGFSTTRFAKDISQRFDIPIYPVQHHFAHVLSLMADNKVEFDEKIIGISTDGVGYGMDRNVWGGEILLCSYNDYQRLGHLQYQPMIGGDRCAKYPARMAASIILNSLGVSDSMEIFKQLEIEKDLEYKDTELKTLISQFENAKGQIPNETIPLTSSTGRIFDTVAYILGISNLRSYRGEPAMRLEALAMKGNPKNINLEIEIFNNNKIDIINTSKLILDILELRKNSSNKPQDIAAKFQKVLGLGFAEVAKKIADTRGFNKIGLTGGVAYNYSFSNTIKEDVTHEGFEFLEHNLVAPGDAGISTGQLIGGLSTYNLDKK